MFCFCLSCCCCLLVCVLVCVVGGGVGVVFCALLCDVVVICELLILFVF